MEMGRKRDRRGKSFQILKVYKVKKQWKQGTHKSANIIGKTKRATRKVWSLGVRIFRNNWEKRMKLFEIMVKVLYSMERKYGDEKSTRK